MERSQFLIEMGSKIRKRRKELNLSQEELAKMTGYKDRSSIARLEKGEFDLSTSKIKLFAAALKIEPEYFTKSSYDDERFSTLNAEELSELDKILKEANLFFNNEEASLEDKELLHKELTEMFFIAKFKDQEKNKK